MNIFKFLKKKDEIIDDDLSEEEAEIAFGIAECAAMLSRENFKRAMIRAEDENKDITVKSYMPFAFGALIEALEGKGISWVKSPHVGVHFVKQLKPDVENPKEMAAILFKLGMEEENSKFVNSGSKAFARFILSDDDYKADDLSEILGLK